MVRFFSEHPHGWDQRPLGRSSGVPFQQTKKTPDPDDRVQHSRGLAERRVEQERHGQGTEVAAGRRQGGHALAPSAQRA
jgi:hypothetical protein